MNGLMFPKSQTKRKKRQHRESILQKKDGRCWLCMRLHGDYSQKAGIHKHHVFFGSGQREISEANGFTQIRANTFQRGFYPADWQIIPVRWYMTAKEFLKAYQAEKIEASVYEERMEELKSLKGSIRANRTDGAPKARRKKDLLDPLLTIDELTERYEAKYILDMLDEMNDAQERTVLILRYIESKNRSGEPLTWWDIAERMDCGKRKAQYIHGRALQHFPME